MMLVPVYPDSAVGQALVAPVERYVTANSVFVFGDELPGAIHRRFFLNGEHKDQVGDGLNASFIKRPNGCKDCFQVSCVIAYPGREYFSISHLGFDLQAFFEHRVQVCIDHDRPGLAKALSNGYEVALGIVIDLVQVEGLERSTYALSPLALLARRSIDLGQFDPLVEDRGTVGIGIIQSVLYVIARNQGHDLDERVVTAYAGHEPNNGQKREGNGESSHFSKYFGVTAAKKVRAGQYLPASHKHNSTV